jgi:hypothetical protein
MISKNQKKQMDEHHMSFIFKKIVYFFTIALFCLILFSQPATGQNYCAVLDLASDGTIPERNCSLISDKISEVIATRSNYMAFDRGILPELLQQFSLDKDAVDCCKPQCLAHIGSLIGANAMIGGTIIHKNNLIEIKLFFVDVATGRTLNTVSLNTSSKKNVFLNSEVPALMKNLLNPPVVATPATKKQSVKNKSFFTNPVLYVGTLFVGGAAAGAYYYKYYYKNDGNNSPGDDQPLSMDDVPVRSRD